MSTSLHTLFLAPGQSLLIWTLSTWNQGDLPAEILTIQSRCFVLNVYDIRAVCVEKSLRVFLWSVHVCVC